VRLDRALRAVQAEAQREAANQGAPEARLGLGVPEAAVRIVRSARTRFENLREEQAMSESVGYAVKYWAPNPGAWYWVGVNLNPELEQWQLRRLMTKEAARERAMSYEKARLVRITRITDPVTEEQAHETIRHSYEEGRKTAFNEAEKACIGDPHGWHPLTPSECVKAIRALKETK
jgi:hypothetical protein